MALSLALARVLGAAVVLAAFSLASSPASAHAGQHHAVVAQPASVETSAGVAPAELSAAPALPAAPSGGFTCDGYGCCASGPCTGCHGFVVTSVIMPIPPLAASSVARSGAPPPSDPRDGRLRRPPKS